MTQPDNYQSWTETANQLKILGRDEEAVAAVEQGNRDEAKPWFETNSDMDSLRGEPRYKALMKRV